MSSPGDEETRVKTPPVTDQPTTPLPGKTTGQVDTSQPALRDLSRRYDILEELGRGGMGVIYCARDRETGDTVALKVLRPEIAEMSELIERFKAELLLARKITHKNVCRTYELLRFDRTVVIAMEFLEGESLRSLLGRVEGLSVRQGLKILRAIIAGLAEAHAQGVVHRDLKPENILITKDGAVKVMDFGIARSLEAGPTQTGGIIGTPAYMSPEQAEGKPVDARTDIYSLGLIMYEIFAGRSPFSADTPAGLAYKQVHETPRPVRSVDPYLPLFLERAIEKCLAKDAKKRFQSVAELEAALDEQSAPQVAAEAEPQPSPELLHWGKRDWALLVLGVIGLAYFLKFRDVVFPPARMPLEADAISARRAAEELIIRTGRPLPRIESAELEYLGDRYWYDLVPRRIDILVRAEPRDLLSAHERAEWPIFWKVTFESTSVGGLAASSAASQRFALADRKGRIVELHNPLPLGWVFPNYQPAPLEQRRALARSTVESTCGPLPSDAKVIEASGGEQGAAHSATFRPTRPLNAPPLARAEFVAEKLVSIDCKPRVERPEFAELATMAKSFVIMWRVAVLWFLAWVVVYFGMAQCYRWPTLWKRLPLAIALGPIAVWLLAPTFDQPPNSGAVGPPASLMMLLGGGLAAGGLLLVGLVTAEYFFVRQAPGWIASYLLAWRGRLAEGAVGLALLRGALAGTALAAVETFLLHVTSLLAARFPGVASVLWAFTSGIADPTPVGQAAASLSPALFVISAAVLNGVLLGSLFIAAPWVLPKLIKSAAPRCQRKRVEKLEVIGLGCLGALATLAFRLPFAQTLSTGTGWFSVPALTLVLAAFVFIQFDVLTVMMAIATATLWTLNYPLLQIFRELGNSAHWAIFIGWGAVVAAAAAVAFRGEILRLRENLRAEMR